jgi:hydroxymethylpyrimidine pyrophosphatase-like HAD family hydrolase
MEPLPALLALDLDGTLLSSDGTLSARNLAALERCRRLGIQLCVASARGGAAIALSVPSVLRDALWVAHCGAAVVQNGITLHSQVLDPVAFRAAVAFAYAWSPPLLMSAEIEGRACASVDVSALWGPGFNVIDFREHLDKPVVKVLVRPPKNTDHSALAVPPGTAKVAHRDGSLVLQQQDVSKHDALDRCLDRLGLGWHQVCAFGDDTTDAGMLAQAGWGVAMGNAVPEAAGAARFRTLSNDEDGVAVFLEEFWQLSSRGA